MANNFLTLADEIEIILEESPEARDDPMAVYALYATRKILRYLSRGEVTPNDLTYHFTNIFITRAERLKMGISSFESVSREIRFIQKARPDLAPTEEEKKKRKEAEAEFRKFFREHKN